MNTFTATNGVVFSEEDFNTLDEMPKGVVFQDLSFNRNKVVKRLPKNLNVMHVLDLTNSRIEEIGENLNVGLRLLAQGTSLIELPAKSNIRNISLLDTKIQKIGAYSEFKRLELDRTIDFNDLRCNHLHIPNKQQDSHVDIDLSDLTTLMVEVEAYQASISSFRTEHLKVSIVKSGGSVQIEDATIDKLEASIHTDVWRMMQTYDLRLNRIACKKAIISSMTINNLIVRINANIEELKFISYPSSFITCLELANQGNVYIEDGYSVILPEHGVIYGDLKVPRGITVPDHLCCFGSVIYY